MYLTLDNSLSLFFLSTFDLKRLDKNFIEVVYN